MWPITPIWLLVKYQWLKLSWQEFCFWTETTFTNHIQRSIADHQSSKCRTLLRDLISEIFSIRRILHRWSKFLATRQRNYFRGWDFTDIVTFVIRLVYRLYIYLPPTQIGVGTETAMWHIIKKRYVGKAYLYRYAGGYQGEILKTNSLWWIIRLLFFLC